MEKGIEDEDRSFLMTRVFDDKLLCPFHGLHLVWKLCTTNVPCFWAFRLAVESCSGPFGVGC